MGLRDDLTEALGDAFGDPELLGDAVRAFTAAHPTGGPGTYNPATGTVDPSTVAYSGRGVFGGFAAREIDGTRVLATDTKLVALQAEVARAPAVGDTLAGLAVIGVAQDPAAATWSIHLRG